MTKSEAYTELFKLEKQGIDIESMIKELAVSKEVSEGLLSKINMYKNYPLFIEKLKEKHFYKTIMNEEKEITLNAYAKALSSLVTHTLIECENLEGTTIKELSESVMLSNVIDAINSYMIKDDDSKIMLMVEKLKELFNKPNLK